MLTKELKMYLTLASASPRRKMLLENLGFELKIISPNIDETPFEGEIAGDLAIRLSQKKAQAAHQNPQSIVLAADTVVACDGQILGKPNDKNEAKQFLKKLSGRFHTVFTGYTLLKGRQQISQVVQTQVWFRELKEEEMEAYVLSDEPYDRAGGYAIQGKAAAFIDRIEGSFTNVIGLPVKEVLASLEHISDE